MTDGKLYKEFLSEPDLQLMIVDEAITIMSYLDYQIML